MVWKRSAGAVPSARTLKWIRDLAFSPPPPNPPKKCFWDRLIGVGGWVVGRESEIPGDIDRYEHITYTYFYAVSNALSQQRFYLRKGYAKDVSSIFCQRFNFYYLFYLFYQRLEILETDKTLQNDFTYEDILPLADKEQLLLSVVGNQSTLYRRSLYVEWCRKIFVLRRGPSVKIPWDVC